MAATPSDQKIAIPGGDALFHGRVPGTWELGEFCRVPGRGRLKVLYIATPSRTGAWLAEALATDSAAEILLEEAAGQAAGMERLRDEVFDAILVSHEPGELDALDLIEGYRTGGAEEPIVVLGGASESEMAVLCYEVGADGYVCVHASTTRNLIWVVARAVQQRHLLHENRRFHHAEQTRLGANRTKPGGSCRNGGQRSRNSVPDRCTIVPARRRAPGTSELADFCRVPGRPPRSTWPCRPS